MCECIPAVTHVAASFIVSLQMEDIKLPMKRGRMEDIGDEEVRVNTVWLSPKEM